MVVMSLGIMLFWFFILTANVVVGYVIAILLGIGPPDYRTAWILVKRCLLSIRTLRFGVPNISLSGMSNLTKHLFIFVSLFKRTVPGTPDESEASVQETTDERLQKIATKDVEEYLEDESAEITRVTAVPELFDDNLMNIIFEQGTETWQASNKHIETSIHKLNLIMMESGQFAGELDKKLRSMQVDASMEEVRRICQSLGDDCRNFLENQSKISTDIHSRVEEFGELKDLAAAIDQSNLNQASQIETTLGSLDQLAQLENAADAVERLIQELANLRKARHNTRDIQDRAFVAIARSENRMETINRNETFIDSATGMNNPIAFQTHLWEWWQQGRHKKTKLTFVLYDIVGFSELNNRVGIRTCDKLLSVLAQWIDERIEGKDFIGLYAGNCLVSVSSNSSLRKTVAFVERIRREAEHTTLILDNQIKDFRIRLTCAVTEAMDQQSETDVIDILDQTLAAAKRAGRGLTWMYDPTKLTPAPEPVESPELSVPDRSFDLDTMQFREASKPME